MPTNMCGRRLENEPATAVGSAPVIELRLVPNTAFVALLLLIGIPVIFASACGGGAGGSDESGGSGGAPTTERTLTCPDGSEIDLPPGDCVWAACGSGELLLDGVARPAPNGSGQCTTRVPGWLDLQGEPSMQLVPESSPSNRVPASSLLLRNAPEGFPVAPFSITAEDKQADCDEEPQALPEVLFIIGPEQFCEGCLGTRNCSGTCPSSCGTFSEDDFTFEVTNVTVDEQGVATGWQGFLEGSLSYQDPSGELDTRYLVVFDVAPQTFLQ